MWCLKKAFGSARLLCGVEQLVGLLEKDSLSSDFVEELLGKATEELHKSIKPGGDAFKSQSLLRFMAQLIPCGLLSSDFLCSILNQIIRITEDMKDDEKKAWQPYSDHLICLVLGTLPFAGAAFFINKKAEEIITKCDGYIQNRPRKSFGNLKPFIGKVEEDVLSSSECGAGGSLIELIAAIKEMQEKNIYSLSCIPDVYKLFEDDLGSKSNISQMQPVSFSCDDMIQSNIEPGQILDWYPPKGIIRLMKEEHTKGDRLLIERIIAEDYFIHTIHFFEGNRVECAKRLARTMPLNYSYEILLCETIFGQMLRLPNSEFKTIMYGTLMVDLCKLVSSFPRPMSACVRECFARMKTIDLCLSQRLAEWLAYHVSNYNFAWPWERWSHVLDVPASDYQRRFCTDVIMRMVRLSYWDRVNDALPEGFRKLLPPKPHHQPLPDINSTTSEDLEGIWASKAVDLIRKKASDEELDDWMKSNALEAVLGGKINLTKMLLRALLVAGQKSYSHMIIALERYFGPLAVLVADGGEDAQLAAIDTIWQVWSGNIQRAAMAIDRMMTLRLVSAKCIVQWIFKSDTLKCTENPKKYSLAWEALFHAIDKTVARVEDIKHDIEMLVSVDANAESPVLFEKRQLLAECESQKSAVITLVVQNFVSVIDDVASTEQDLANLSSLNDMQVDTNQPKGIVIYDLARFTQAFSRHYFTSASCSAEIRDIFAAARFPLTKSLMESSICL